MYYYEDYLGGRDLFDLWFHWLRKSDWHSQEKEIRHLVKLKLTERKLRLVQFQQNLKNRLVPHPVLSRARLEWKRYLPPNFQNENIFKDIIKCHQKLKGWLENGAS